MERSFISKRLAKNGKINPNSVPNFAMGLAITICMLL
jgi:hypothetical protein